MVFSFRGIDPATPATLGLIVIFSVDAPWLVYTYTFRIATPYRE